MTGVRGLYLCKAGPKAGRYIVDIREGGRRRRFALPPGTAVGAARAAAGRALAEMTGETARVRGRSTHVYAFRCTHSRLVKVGRATNVASRLGSTQTGHPYDLVLEIVHGPCDAVDVERRLHALLTEQRFRREWFDADEARIAAAFAAATEAAE